MNKETEELANYIAGICPDKVDDCCSCSGGTPCYLCLSKALIDLGYRKMEVKTNGDYIRKVYEKSDDELAHDKIVIYSHWENDQLVSECSAELVHKTFDAYYKAYNANLEWLQQEYKEKQE